MQNPLSSTPKFLKMNKILIYPGHKLTRADPAFIEKMNVLKAFLEKELSTCALLNFLGVKLGTRGDVYKKDILTNVKTCDLFVAIADEESTGLGIEVGAALWYFGRPILVLYHVSAMVQSPTSDKAGVSRLIGGAVDYNQEQMIERPISCPEDALMAVKEAIELFRIGSPNPVLFDCFERRRDPSFGIKQPEVGTQPEPFPDEQHALSPGVPGFKS